MTVKGSLQKELPAKNLEPVFESMSIWGIGWSWMWRSLLFSSPLILAAWMLPDFFLVSRISPRTFYIAGGLLLCLGIPFWFFTALRIKGYYEKGILCTTGPFAFCRNPIYGAWIFFLIPGIVLLLRMPLLLLVPLIMYHCLLKPLKREEQWLLRKYGALYEIYAQGVPRLCPGIADLSRIWRRRRYY